jgi:uncharacterized membrane protein YedE/YeeE
MRTPRAYSDPYLAGAALGVVLLASFAFAGRGIGISGAFNRMAGSLVAIVDAEGVQQNPVFARQIGNSWLLFEVAGVMLGAFVSAFLAGRFKVQMERGPHATTRARAVTAIGGGMLMGGGAALARGCTSGLALSGGAMLSAGAWLFVGTAFAAAYLVAPIVRKLWI